MFCVYGVSRKACEKKAHQQIAKLRGAEKPTTQAQYQAKLEEITETLFVRLNPTCISGELATPSSVHQFIELAKKSDGFRSLVGMRKVPATDKKGEIKISKSTKKPIFTWQKLESNFSQEMADKSLTA
ncbi:hypothetical protein ORI99_00705 [Alishewanella sp. SMS9]|nr:hypothetical protein [Alishewanella sp. SMS9]